MKDFNIAVVKYRYKNKGAKRRKINEAHKDLESAVQVLNQEGIFNMFRMKLYDKHWHTVEYIQQNIKRVKTYEHSNGFITVNYFATIDKDQPDSNIKYDISKFKEDYILIKSDF